MKFIKALLVKFYIFSIRKIETGMSMVRVAKTKADVWKGYGVSAIGFGGIAVGLPVVIGSIFGFISSLLTVIGTPAVIVIALTVAGAVFVHRVTSIAFAVAMDLYKNPKYMTEEAIKAAQATAAQAA